jgi:hypothetical protein
VEADAEGVRSLRFVFPKPLNDPSYCFYVTTTECGAAKLRFRNGMKPAMQEAQAAGTNLDRIDVSGAVIEAAQNELEAGRASAAKVLFAAGRGGDENLARKAEAGIRPVGKFIAAATGSTIQCVFDRERFSSEDWERLQAWWGESVDDQLLSVVWLHRNDFYPLIRSRWDIWHCRYWAGRVLSSDLYLTGPPFPGVRAAASMSK